MIRQSDESIVTANWIDDFKAYFYRIAANGALPANWFEQRLPELESRAERTGELSIELVSHQGCLDELSAQLQGRQEAIFFPLEERTTALLTEDDPLLKNKDGEFRLEEIQTDQFETRRRTRATGPLQITHGEVARACGYCDAIPVYQKPARHWCKAHEDRAFRWLLGTQGTRINFPGTYRIRHITKGRYRQDKVTSKLRTKVRQAQSTLRGE